MDSALDFANLFVDTDAGELLYFLLAVGLSLIALLMAIDQRARSREEPEAGQYILSLVGVVMAWGALTLGNLITLLVKDADAHVILPPLEKVSTALVLVMLGRAFLIADIRRPERAFNGITLVVVILLVGGYAYTALTWNQDADGMTFNAHQLGLVWTVIPIVLMILMILLLFTRYSATADIPLKGIFAGVVIAGHSYTLLQMGHDNLTGNASGAVRVSMLAGLVFVPVILYRLIIDRFRDRIGGVSNYALSISQKQQDMTPAYTYQEPMSTPQPIPLHPSLVPPSPARADKMDSRSAARFEAMSLLKILGDMLHETNPDLITQRIVVAVASAFQSDMVAICSVTDASWLEISSVYDYIHENHLPGLGLNLDHQPTIAAAISSNKQYILQPDTHHDELVDLYHRLDVSKDQQIGPAYIQPLSRDRKVVGALILTHPFTYRILDTGERQLLEAMGPIAARLLVLSQTALRNKQAAQKKAIEDMAEGRLPFLSENESSKTIRAELQESLAEARQEIEILNHTIEDLRGQITHERDKLAKLLPEGTELTSITQRINILADEREAMQTAHKDLVKALQESNTMLAGATSDSEIEMYRHMVASLKQEKRDLLIEKRQLEHELAILTGGASSMNQLVEVVQSLTEQRNHLAQEQMHLLVQHAEVQTKLSDLGIEDGMVGLGQMLAQLTEERNQYQQQVEQVMAERDILLSEHQDYKTERESQEKRQKQIEALQNEVVRLASDSEAMRRQREALMAERDALNEQRDEWLTTRANLIKTVDDLRQKLSKASTTLDMSQTQQMRIERARTEATAERDRLQAERLALQAERDALMAREGGNRERLEQVNQDSVQAFQDVIAELTAERSRLELQLTEAQENMRLLEKQIDRLEAVSKEATTQEGTPSVEPHSGEMIMSLVQELRNPLTSIMGYTDLLLSEARGILVEAQKHFLIRVKLNTERLMQVLEDLVRVVAIDAGALLLAPIEVDMEDLIDDAITMNSQRYSEKGLQLNLNIEENLPHVRADRDAIQQVLTQLLTNAYLVSPPGSVVKIKAEYQPGYPIPMMQQGEIHTEEVIYFSIADQGGGIPEEDIKRVFTRLYRASNPLIQGLGETGVGLSIAHALITAHGGYIWAETNPGFSTTFHFVLPVNHIFGDQKLMPARAKRLHELFEGDFQAIKNPDSSIPTESGEVTD